MKVRTRIAPSPTGFFHVGNMRTALYDYALAMKHGGQFILRIEDTDQTRYLPEAVDYIIKLLNNFGLQPNEGVGVGGPHEPYVQSERLELYRKYAEELVEKGLAYYCFMNEAETEDTQLKYRDMHKGLRSPYRDLALEEAKQRAATGDKFTIRQKLPENEQVEFIDGMGDKTVFNTSDIEEWVMIKSDGFPTYNFAVVIDDHLMDITHVFRGVEFVSSAPKNALLYKAFGWEVPQIFHLPVLMDPEGGKLSKRKGATAAGEFLTEGYLPEAILNFLMLLGWSSPEERVHGQEERELYSLADFIELFDPKDLNKSNPVFNREKLLWFNQKYISGMNESQLAEKLISWFDAYAEDKLLAPHIKTDVQMGTLAAKLALVKERSKTLSELAESLKFFYVTPQDIDWNIPQLERVKDLVPAIVGEIKELISGLDIDSANWKHEDWEMGMRAIGDKHGAKHGDVFMVLRVAIVGAPFSPPLFESLQLLGKEQVLTRLK